MSDKEFSFLPHIWFIVLASFVLLGASMFTGASVPFYLPIGMLIACGYLFINYLPHSSWIGRDKKMYTQVVWDFLKGDF